MRTILLAHVRRVVIKIGSGVVSGDTGLDQARIEGLCGDIVELRKRGFEVVVVSSGAVAASASPAARKPSRSSRLPPPSARAA
jgi:glutamate 5-kinase